MTKVVNVESSTLTKVQAARITERIRSSVENTYALIQEAYEAKAWVALGYPSWKDYVRAEFDLSKGQSYRLLDQAQVIKELSAAAGTEVRVSAREAARVKHPAVVVDESDSRARATPEPEKVQLVPDAGSENLDENEQNARDEDESGTITPLEAAQALLIAQLESKIVGLEAEIKRLEAELAKQPPAKKETKGDVKKGAAVGRGPAPRNPPPPARSKSVETKSDCRHPINRRIKSTPPVCGACGKEVR